MLHADADKKLDLLIDMLLAESEELDDLTVRGEGGLNSRSAIALLSQIRHKEPAVQMMYVAFNHGFYQRRACIFAMHSKSFSLSYVTPCPPEGRQAQHHRDTAKISSARRPRQRERRRPAPAPYPLPR